MKSLRKIIQDTARTGTVTRVEGLSRREIAKIRSELRRPIHPTVTTQLMNTHRINTGGKCYWPTVYSRPAPEQERVVRNGIVAEHPMITARRKEYPKTR